MLKSKVIGAAVKSFFSNVKSVLQKVDCFLERVNDGFLKFFRKHYIWIVFFVIFVGSLVVRIAFFPFISGDMRHALLTWFNYLKSNGGFKALRTYPWDTSVITKPGDYPVAYINLLALLSYLPGEGVNLIKSSSIIFDYVLAFGALFIVREFNKNKFLSLITFTVFVFFPTSVLNSSIWGQADQMYAALIVWSLWLLFKDKPRLATVPLGFALAVKLQAVFFIPVLIFMWLAKRFKLRHLLYLPLVMFMTFLPSYLAGAPFKMPFEMYNEQINTLYRNANYGAGSVYAFFEMWQFRDGINNYAGVVSAFIVVGVTLLFLYHYEIPATNKNLVFVTTLFALVVPFVLPHMHERYFYLADAFVILYVIVYRRKYVLAVLMSFSSVLAYTHFLTGEYIFKFLNTDSVRLAALLNLAIIITLIYDAGKVLEKKPPLEQRSALPE